MKIIGICGYSGSGKTTLLKQLIPALKQQGLRVAAIKHSHHNMDIDIPGKDSYELRKSGADQTIVVCEHRWALIKETPVQPASLITLTQQFTDIDLVLVEGFKDETIPKIICHRQQNNKPLYSDDYAIALVTDTYIESNLPVFSANNLEQLVKFIQEYILKLRL